MNWDEIFEEASRLLGVEHVVQAEKCKKENRQREAKATLLSAIDSEVNRLKRYSVTGKLSADAQTLMEVRKLVAGKLFWEDVKTFFPQVGKAIRDGTINSGVWDLISWPIKKLEKFDPTGIVSGLRKAVSATLKAIPIIRRIVNNTDGIRDNLIRTCQTAKATVKAYCSDVYHKVKEHVKTGVRATASAIRTAAVSVVRRLSAVVEKVGQAGRKVWGWLRAKVDR